MTVTSDPRDDIQRTPEWAFFEYVRLHLREAWDDYQRRRDQHAIANLLNWSQSMFESYTDLFEEFPVFGSVERESTPSHTYADHAYCFTCTVAGVTHQITRDLQLKYARDKNVHGRQKTFNQNRPNNDRNWLLLSNLVVRKTEYMVNLLQTTVEEQFSFNDAIVTACSEAQQGG